MKAEIIAVGSELLTPDRLDTNSLFLTEELNKIGIEVLRKTVVGDNRELLDVVQHLRVEGRIAPGHAGLHLRPSANGGKKENTGLEGSSHGR